MLQSYPQRPPSEKPIRLPWRAIGIVAGAVGLAGYLAVGVWVYFRVRDINEPPPERLGNEWLERRLEDYRVSAKVERFLYVNVDDNSFLFVGRFRRPAEVERRLGAKIRPGRVLKFTDPNWEGPGGILRVCALPGGSVLVGYGPGYDGDWWQSERGLSARWKEALRGYGARP